MPAVRFVDASKPLMGKVKKVWNVKERLLMINSALCAAFLIAVAPVSTSRP